MMENEVKKEGSDPAALMRPEEVAARLNLKQSTVYHQVHRGILPGFKIGGALRFNRATIEKLISDLEPKLGSAA